MASVTWCKVAHDLDNHPKIRRAGNLGSQVFQYALRKNAAPGVAVPGLIPEALMEAWYIADQLQISEADAQQGIQQASSAGLLAPADRAFRIVGWDDGEWGRGEQTTGRYVGGRARAEKAQRGTNGAFLSSNVQQPTSNHQVQIQLDQQPAKTEDVRRKTGERELARAHDPPTAQYEEPSSPPELPESAAPAGADPLAVSAPIARAYVAGKRAARVEPLADGGLDRWCTARWDEVNAHRVRIAAAKGLEKPRPLHPMDGGRRELALRMREGYSREDIAHVIAVLVAEAETKGSLQWLVGAMFDKRRVDNALGRSLADARGGGDGNRATTTNGYSTDDGMLVMREAPVDEVAAAKRKAEIHAERAAREARTPEQVAAALAERERKLEAMRVQSRIDNARIPEPLS